jgi:aerobic-type carbon monoxide dehydrogenase small subunit (CoxS/CutS family)
VSPGWPPVNALDGIGGFMPAAVASGDDASHGGSGFSGQSHLGECVGVETTGFQTSPLPNGLARCLCGSDERQELSRPTLAIVAEETEITTIEGLWGEQWALDPMQRAIIEQDAYQSGYRTPEQTLSAIAVVQEGHAWPHWPSRYCYRNNAQIFDLCHVIQCHHTGAPDVTTVLYREQPTGSRQATAIAEHLAAHGARGLAS